MIRISKWPGLVTAASPYVIPAGASVEQVNAQSSIPGQLTVRGGMGSVGHTCNGNALACNSGSVVGGLLEIWGYSPGSGASEVIFGFTDAGELVRLTGLSAP
jgi:hypothetical protein